MQLMLPGLEMYVPVSQRPRIDTGIGTVKRFEVQNRQYSILPLAYGRTRWDFCEDDGHANRHLQIPDRPRFTHVVEFRKPLGYGRTSFYTYQVPQWHKRSRYWTSRYNSGETRVIRPVASHMTERYMQGWVMMDGALTPSVIVVLYSYQTPVAVAAIVRSNVTMYMEVIDIPRTGGISPTTRRHMDKWRPARPADEIYGVRYDAFRQMIYRMRDFYTVSDMEWAWRNHQFYDIVPMLEVIG